MQLGDAGFALPALQRARELDPGHALTLAALGIALNQAKRYAEAKETLDRALRLSPEDPEILAVLAEAEEGLDDHAAAEGHARSALERNPRHPVALLVVGMIRMQQQRYDEARDALEDAVAAAPESSKAHYQLSLACTRVGDRACAAREVELHQKTLHAVVDRLNALRTQSLESAPLGANP
jgi:cytochrome c-type biogenesis protein CcmH/NrfG